MYLRQISILFHGNEYHFSAGKDTIPDWSNAVKISLDKNHRSWNAPKNGILVVTPHIHFSYGSGVSISINGNPCYGVHVNGTANDCNELALTIPVAKNDVVTLSTGAYEYYPSWFAPLKQVNWKSNFYPVNYYEII